MTFGAGIILINSNNEVLLLLRDDKPEIPFPNHWDIHGGRIEEGETPELTIRREISEEFGIMSLSDFKLFKIYLSDNLTDFIFWKRINLNPKEIALSEGQMLKYFSFDELRNTQLAFNYNQVLEEFFKEVVNNV